MYNNTNNNNNNNNNNNKHHNDHDNSNRNTTIYLAYIYIYTYIERERDIHTYHYSTHYRIPRCSILVKYQHGNLWYNTSTPSRRDYGDLREAWATDGTEAFQLPRPDVAQEVFGLLVLVLEKSGGFLKI